VIVCEASSFQLEDTSTFAPEAAVLVNLAPDHLDRHPSFAAYISAKAAAFARQREEHIAVMPSALLARVGTSAEPQSGSAQPADRQSGGTQSAEPQSGDPQSADARETAQAMAELACSGRARRVAFGTAPDAQMRDCDGRLWWQGRELIALEELSLPGRHNRENAMAAAAVCLARGLSADAVAAALRGFSGVAHRLELIATRGGVSFVNDSKATNVASTLVALEAFERAPGIHLILGGQGKGQDFDLLRAAVQRNCRAIYLIGEDAELIGAALGASGVALRRCGELERAVADARRGAIAGEVVLLSPACASFDQFSDFEARGERFRRLVRG
jgi:UDP-N-acetylmuramoylalanine--D-glutamate ligase